ncbi:MAG TPA: recombinase family protein [Pirellulales bacterium]|nr:recombinase family protein [Pirellulales bacterium]
MRVVGYVRVSTEEQSRDGVSLPTQRAKLTGYAELYELELVRIIEDAGESAKSLKRPGLQELLGLLRKGEADGLVIAKLDRLTRSITDWQTLIDGYFGERSRFGKQLFSVGDSIDTRTAAGRLVLNVLLSVAQWEREAIGERTRDALQHKIRQGERCGKIRFGFDLTGDGKMLVPNEAEQEVIARMLALRGAGRTLREIADELTSLGIATKEGRGRWAHQAVARILNREQPSSNRQLPAGGATDEDRPAA